MRGGRSVRGDERDGGRRGGDRVVTALVAVGSLLAGLVSPDVGRAGEADVLVARAECTALRVCSFSVTVKHADTGWRHYASRFEIVGPDGAVLATRVLRHPHVHEQPFTRSLAGVEVPEGVDRVTVRAIDEVHGAGGETVEVALVFPATAPAPAPAAETTPAP
jgi:hypothetical protein